MTKSYSNRMDRLMGILAPVNRFFANSTWIRRAGEPDICDFVLGNPHQPALPDFAAALKRNVEPRNSAWYAYKMNEPEPRATIARILRQERDRPFEPEDIFLTNGAFAALAVALDVVTDPGDEVIFVSPPWFFYESLIAAAGARPVRVKIDLETFDLDLRAIEEAISERTRAIIVNSPHNPTGKIYPSGTLEELSRILTEASQERERPIYLLSDEAYCRIRYDGRDFPSPTAFYPDSMLIYTYGKTLLTPGQRIGYIALPPAMARREELRPAILTAQYMIGFAFPNALLQHSLADLESLSIDVEQLARRRDRLVQALRVMGYELQVPEGTFYLLVRSPMEDDEAFIELLAEHDVFCLPGTVVELPGYFRISLTANDQMVDRSLPGFKKAIDRAREVTPAVP